MLCRYAASRNIITINAKPARASHKEKSARSIDLESYSYELTEHHLECGNNGLTWQRFVRRQIKDSLKKNLSRIWVFNKNPALFFFHKFVLWLRRFRVPKRKFMLLSANYDK